MMLHIQFTASFAVLFSLGVLDLRSSSLKVIRWAFGGITGSSEHLQREYLSPDTLSFHFPSDFAKKGSLGHKFLNRLVAGTMSIFRNTSGPGIPYFVWI
jgi:hypothetical protein